MIVCIAEKPSVARDIANVLGAKDMKQGYIEGNGYQVTWTFGHLCELKEPDEYNPRWKRWDLWDLPMIPQRYGIRLKNDDGVQRQFATIEKLMQAADGIINCGDAGQEGELIQRWVMQKAGAKCPVKRLWISSLTEEAIREGFNSLKDQIEYQSLYEAGLCRAIGDWTLGMNATRLYTLKYGQQKQVLSIGRVQTPTLALIVRRQQEIESFVPKQSWVLSTLYRDTKFTAIAHDEEAEAEDAAEVKAAAEQGKTIKGKGPIYKQIEFQTEEEGKAVLEAIKDQPFTVTDIQKKKGTEAPPRLYDLTSLQVDCNRKFGYSAEQTLQLIQSLYEKKFTTYPRVDTTFLSDDIYAKCPQTLRGLKGYEQFTQPLEGKPLLKSKKVFDSSKVTDHHAIIPTGVPAISLTDMERRVYDLVTRAFIAVFYPDCKFETTTVYGEVGGLVLFRTSGRTILDEGWKVIYKDTKDIPDDNTPDGSLPITGEGRGEGLPLFTKGESGSHIPSLTEKWTQPPKPYTEATLLRAMETAGKFVDNEELRDAMKENGIGRPSTRAAIIETLFKRRYIRKERKSLVATPTGVELIGIIHEELLKSAELTGIWEKKLREIEKKQYDAQTFIEELKQMVTDIINQVRNDTSNRHVAITTEEDLKKKAPRPPKGEGIRNVSQEVSVHDAHRVSPPPSGVGGLAPAGFQPQKKAAPKKSAKKSTEDVKAAHDPDSIIGLPCPICHEGHIIKGKTAYGCSRWKEGCTYRLPFDQA
ncbi:MAG: DNA topoisomerase 3 [Bacteroidaceae bacterium]|nr:DNA topoisomerase 3 [Bacteroidaceae bacterium]